jgi:hypothetical protein
VGIGCFLQQTCPILHPVDERLHQEQAKNSCKTPRDTTTQSKKFKGSAKALQELIDVTVVGDDLRLPRGANV